MGHHISKQQNQQVSDDQQVTSSVEHRPKSSTTAKSLQVKNSKNWPVKKSKKHQQSDVKTLEPNKSLANSSTERSAGSVVITIRLLKMESAKEFETVASVTGDDTKIAANNTLQMSSNLPQNHHLDNNSSELNANNWIKGNGGIQINSFINNNSERNSINRLATTTAALHSEASICDKNQKNCAANDATMVNGLTHPLDAIKLTDIKTDSNDPKTMKPDDTSAFISTNLTTTVSPYPHHIPIANFIRTDCLNAANTVNATDESTSSKAISTGTNTEFNMNHPIGGTVSAQQSAALQSTLFSTSAGNVIVVTMDQPETWFTPDEFTMEDCDKKARLQRAIEIAEGVDPPPGFIATKSLQSLNSMSTSNLQLLPQINDANAKVAGSKHSLNVSHWAMICANNPAQLRLLMPSLLQHADDVSRIHSQEGYIHCLVPDLKQITSSTFYWGKMDRYEAERLLDNKPEGTFLLRDSAQEEFLFSVSFRKYGRSLHARIEQFNHKFSFDCHDPGVYMSKTVTGLLEHYKNPECVMFFEPALTLPLHRNFSFSLQQLCRATIVSHTTYDGINEMCLPKKLKSYLKEYHYKQRVRVRRFDESNYNNA